MEVEEALVDTVFYVLPSSSSYLFHDDKGRWRGFPAQMPFRLHVGGD
jgi:hypothetical protein